MGSNRVKCAKNWQRVTNGGLVGGDVDGGIRAQDGLMQTLVLGVMNRLVLHQLFDGARSLGGVLQYGLTLAMLPLAGAVTSLSVHSLFRKRWLAVEWGLIACWLSIFV